MARRARSATSLTLERQGPERSARAGGPAVLMLDRATATLQEERDPPAPPVGAVSAAESARSGQEEPLGRARRGRLRRNPIRTGLVVALLVPLTIVGWSYGHALTVPSSDSLATRSVEWVRAHG